MTSVLANNGLCHVSATDSISHVSLRLLMPLLHNRIASMISYLNPSLAFTDNLQELQVATTCTSSMLLAP
jgi:hypothetical protein